MASINNPTDESVNKYISTFSRIIQYKLNNHTITEANANILRNMLIQAQTNPNLLKD